MDFKNQHFNQAKDVPNGFIYKKCLTK